MTDSDTEETEERAPEEAKPKVRAKPEPFKPSLMRRPGIGNILIGVLFLAGGIAVTYIWKEVFWWGAMVFGGIEICIGVYKLIRS